MKSLYNNHDLLRDLRRMRIGTERFISGAPDSAKAFVMRKTATIWSSVAIGDAGNAHDLNLLKTAEYVRFFVEHGRFPEQQDQLERMFGRRRS